MPYTLYRIIRHGTAAPDDFRSNLAQCLKPRPLERRQPHIWAGVSTFDQPALAEERARLYPLGAYLATLEIDERDPRVIVQQTLGEGHYTVLGCEEVVHSLVQTVRPIVGLTDVRE